MSVTPNEWVWFIMVVSVLSLFMAWILPTESDVLTVLSETELATYRAAAMASG